MIIRMPYVVKQYNTMKHILPCGDHYQLIDSQTISYVQACQNYTKIYLLDETMIFCSLSMVKLLNCLGSQFQQIHKSYLINLHTVVRCYKAGAVLLNNGVQVPISRRRQKELLSKWEETIRMLESIENNTTHQNKKPFVNSQI